MKAVQYNTKRIQKEYKWNKIQNNTKIIQIKQNTKQYKTMQYKPMQSNSKEYKTIQNDTKPKVETLLLQEHRR